MIACSSATRIERDDRDRQLVDSLRRGDAGAAERLFTTYVGRAYRLAIGITANAQDAEEVVQDAFLRVIRKIDTFRGESPFGSWLYRIVANAAFQKMRRRSRKPAGLTLDEVLPQFDRAGRHATPVADWSAVVEDPSRRIEVRLAVSSAIEELPPHNRAAVVLKDIQGWSHAEIARVLGISVAAVKTRLHRARLFIRKQLAESPLAACSSPGRDV